MEIIYRNECRRRQNAEVRNIAEFRLWMQILDVGGKGRPK
jgi:hypothetical protein